MLHESKEFVIVLAGEGKGPIHLLDKSDGLAQLVGRKALTKMRKVEFAYQAPRHSVAMKDRSAATHGQGLKGMAQGMPQVERLADVLLRGVLFHDILLGANGLHDKRLQGIEVGTIEVIAHESRPMLLGADEPVLEHLGKAGGEILRIERLQELRRHHHGLGRIECSHLVLQRVEVDARLAAHGRIDHSQ